MKSLKSQIALGVSVASAAFIVACGGDSNSSDAPAKNDTISLSDKTEVVCNAKNDGAVAFTADKEYVRCEEGNWEEITEKEASKADKIIGKPSKADADDEECEEDDEDCENAADSDDKKKCEEDDEDCESSDSKGEDNDGDNDGDDSDDGKGDDDGKDDLSSSSGNSSAGTSIDVECEADEDCDEGDDDDDDEGGSEGDDDGDDEGGDEIDDRIQITPPTDAATEFNNVSIPAISWPEDAPTSLWSMDQSLAWQVQTPEVIECREQAAEKGVDYWAACTNEAELASTDGWWWGFFSRSDTYNYYYNATPIKEFDEKTGAIKLATDDGEGQALPNGNFDNDDGLFINLSATGYDVEHPAVMGLGWNWKRDSKVDISDHEGLCISYYWKSNASDYEDCEGRLDIELDIPDDEEKLIDWDTFYYTLKESDGSENLILTWDKFKKDGYKSKYAVSYFTQNSKGVKFRLKNGSQQNYRGTLIIHSIGWAEECMPSVDAPIVSPEVE